MPLVRLRRRAQGVLLLLQPLLVVLGHVGADVLRFEKTLELHVGELTNLRLRVVLASFLFDALANLSHDSLDIDRLSVKREFGHKCMFQTRRWSRSHAPRTVDDQYYSACPECDARQ